MASTIGGSVVWNLDVDPNNFNRGLDSASRQADEFKSKINKIDFSGMANQASRSFGQVADSIGGVLKGLAVMSIASGFGFGAMTKAAFAQVKQVENASFALKAYEKSGKKVTKVLSELVAYARSDLGVLFQRQDLFDAASTLKIYGVETQNLTRYTKIMSKGVAIGKTSFQELSEILGRVAAEGKLTSDSFDVLVRRGIKLPQSLRNASVSAEELFRALDKSLPDKLLEGRANTIEGRMIRLQSAFRDLGGAILGVDRDTSTFIKGGLGDQFVTLLEDLRTKLRDPAIVKSFKKIGQSVADFTKSALPKLVDGFTWLLTNYDTVVAAVAAIGAAFVTAKIGQAISGIVDAISGFNAFGVAANTAAAGAHKFAAAGAPMVAGGGWIGIIVVAIIALVAAIVFLQVKFKLFTKLWDNLKKAAEPVVNWFQVNVLPTLEKIGSFIGGQFQAAWRDLVKAFNELKTQLQPLMPVLKIIGIALMISIVVPILAVVAAAVIFVGVVIAIVTALARLVGWFARLLSFIIPIGKWMKTQMIANFEKAKNTIISFGTTVFNVMQKVRSVFQTVFMFIFNVVKTYLMFVFNIWKTVLTAIWGVLKWVIALVLAIFIWVFTGIFNIVKTYLTFIYNFWKTIFTAIWSFLSPILTAIWNTITTVISFIWNIIKTYLTMIFNVWKTVFVAIWNVVSTVFMTIWNTIKTVLGFIWNTIKTVFTAIWNTIKSIATSIWNVISSIFNSVKNTVTSVWNSIYNTIKDRVTKVKDTIVGIKDKVMGVFKSVGSWLTGAGKDLITGLINGIKSMGGTLKDKITGFIKDNVPGPVLKVLGIQSPSKVFANIGTNIVQGLSQGINQGKELLKSTSLNMAANVITPSVMSPEVTGESNSGGVYITNEIGSITLANDVDADRFIQKLTQQDDIISRGLIPQRYGNG